jgi:phage shock protein C
MMTQQILPGPDAQGRGPTNDQIVAHNLNEPATRVVRRSREDRVIAGVCGGAGRYLGIDPVLLRLAFIALTLGAGSGVLLYVVLWIVIPEARPDEELAPAPAMGRDTLHWVIGGGLVVLGMLLLAGRVLPWWDERFIWPAVLIVIGLAVLAKGVRR